VLKKNGDGGRNTAVVHLKIDFGAAGVQNKYNRKNIDGDNVRSGPLAMILYDTMLYDL